jgi:hypothetical protein
LLSSGNVDEYAAKNGNAHANDDRKACVPAITRPALTFPRPINITGQYRVH